MIGESMRRNQEIPDMEMTYPFPVSWEMFIQGENKLGIVVPDLFQAAELPLHRRFFRQEVGNLDIQPFIPSLGNKIYFPFIEDSDPYRVPLPSEFEIHDVFQQAADLGIPGPHETVPQPGIADIILVEILQMLFSLDTIPADSVDEKRLLEIPEICYHRIRSNRDLLILEKR